MTLQELATKLNGKFWSKDGKERVYLERGYNTKKMSTSTYVELINGNLVVKCFVNCDSQTSSWCKSQADIVIENVEEEISEIIELAKVELIEARLSNDETQVEVKISYNGKTEDNFLTETEFDERFNKYPQSVFNNLPETKKPEAEQIVAVTENSIPTIKHELGNGRKCSHPRFGLGEITEEFQDGDFTKFRILFVEHGEKLLLERFANLTFL